jgi:hypothetical protein
MPAGASAFSTDGSEVKCGEKDYVVLESVEVYSEGRGSECNSGGDCRRWVEVEVEVEVKCVEMDYVVLETEDRCRAKAEGVSATREVAVGAGSSRGRGRERNGLRVLRSCLVHESSKQLANPVCHLHSVPSSF